MNKSNLNRFFLNQCTIPEREEITQWLLDPSNDNVIRHFLLENWQNLSLDALEDIDGTADMEKIWGNIKTKIQEKQLDSINNLKSENYPKPFFLYFRKTAAAIILGLLCTAYFLYNFHSSNGQPDLTKATSAEAKHDIAPPTSAKAVLKLADGSVVYLDSAVKGTLARQGGIEVYRNAGGEIIYSGKANESVTMNTLSLPKGSKPIRLVLADGSLVWLNAASSVTYPTAFIGNERRVSITGEAYFEVSPNKSMPFFVEHNKMLVKVLGTHFNVNAFDNEANIKVTLLEGMVDVGDGSTTRGLVPGQQASISKRKISIEEDVDIEEVMAWKNGQFYFGGADIRSIMKQIERYYDVEVEFRDEVPYQFVAKISRDVNVSAFLEKLELTNLIHFNIEGNKIIVMK